MPGREVFADRKRFVDRTVAVDQGGQRAGRIDRKILGLLQPWPNTQRLHFDGGADLLQRPQHAERARGGHVIERGHQSSVSNSRAQR